MTTHRVVVNDEGQYSVWPVDGAPLTGWDDAGFVGTRDECLDQISLVWTDMRPASVRRLLDGDR